MTGGGVQPWIMLVIRHADADHRRDLADQFDLEALGVRDRRQDDALDRKRPVSSALFRPLLMPTLPTRTSAISYVMMRANSTAVSR